MHSQKCFTDKGVWTKLFGDHWLSSSTGMVSMNKSRGCATITLTFFYQNRFPRNIKHRIWKTKQVCRVFPPFSPFHFLLFFYFPSSPLFLIIFGTFPSINFSTPICISYIFLSKIFYFIKPKAFSSFCLFLLVFWFFFLVFLILPSSATISPYSWHLPIICLILHFLPCSS